ncbi:hypothetical protein A2U01_0063833 [Trifolium medium]|uniref:Uncharacterized protein n=1 Tax=Trifolium medium TaxID=97028 RepID=A0A392S3Z5_9FABA|nr:hypothetical protein [Trifolium medium]
MARTQPQPEPKVTLSLWLSLYMWLSHSLILYMWLSHKLTLRLRLRRMTGSSLVRQTFEGLRRCLGGCGGEEG